MMFSTKAEYGVRVMVELARRAGDEPIPLAEIAAHDGLPLAYLEHLVARLRKAGDKKVWFVDTAAALPPEYREGTVDGVHPTDLGFLCLAKALTPVLRRILG